MFKRLRNTFARFRKKKPDYRRTRESRWITVKESGNYELQVLQEKYLDMDTGEEVWFDYCILHSPVDRLVPKEGR